MEPSSRKDLWAAVHAERTRLAEDLAGLDETQWAQPSLCAGWTVEDVVAHLTAAASLGRFRWLRSMLGARFDAGLHNQRRLEEHRGATPAETLQLFRAVAGSTMAPSKDTAAWLGEVVVHGQDVRRPLGLPSVPPVEVVTAVARFFVRKDFAVPSRSAARGLRLVATDGPFASGSGALVSGPTLALVMALAGRAACCDELTGEGVPLLRSRCPAG
ncbi:maleylpyruvate isomerase family mycothiol-dependent enzyme [Kocuria sp. CPCC 205268]|uniref:maleylpyruvate isomerase family mycothiol-dependent enzyme n=1 Tax=Kocuria oxytropis TaxID=3058913 RepID=UPI0034D45A32